MLDKRKFFLAPERHIIRAERGCDMHDTGSIRISYKIRPIDRPSARMILYIFIIIKFIKRRSVFFADKILSGYLALKFIRRTAKNSFGARHCDNIFFPVSFIHPIPYLWRHSEGDVPGKRPWCRRPRQNVCVFFSNNRKSGCNGNIRNVFVSLRDFKI